MRKSTGLVSEFPSELSASPASSIPSSVRRGFVFKNASLDISDVTVGPTVDPTHSVYETVLEKEDEKEEEEPVVAPMPSSSLALARRKSVATVLSFDVTKVNPRGRRQLFFFFFFQFFLKKTNTVFSGSLACFVCRLSASRMCGLRQI
jgi:hypothetical protein